MDRTDLVVLAVDDDRVNRMLLKSMLKKSGIVAEIIEAENGSEAIDVLKSRDDIDIVLLDIIMPIMNGIEMLQVAREDSNLRQVPIIMLTTDETRKAEALDHGANDFLMKPIRKDELVEKMKNLIL
ncbi:Copper-sensing two-component system response regulator CpxR [hydrothermal vent metagenome]|uniref:Copper-sensing two-component system response regulator CpxR n=1 Tax=hydrothermal vent metagenome TaxID=652676 RepID=A0A1W1D241_9ZZZZ